MHHKDIFGSQFLPQAAPQPPSVRSMHNSGSAHSSGSRQGGDDEAGYARGSTDEAAYARGSVDEVRLRRHMGLFQVVRPCKSNCATLRFIEHAAKVCVRAPASLTAATTATTRLHSACAAVGAPAARLSHVPPSSRSTA